MEKFEFKSAICTSVEQSKRLLELGLKKETADMVHYSLRPFTECWTIIPLDNGEVAENYNLEIPAWSLHRLMLLYDKTIEFEDWNLNEAYEHIMILIEDAIRGGFFNPQFLEDKQ